MTQFKTRGSYAVMSQRIEPKASLDFFPTPPWATRALCEWLYSRWSAGKESWMIGEQSAWDPACGDGAMVKVLEEYFDTVHRSDVFDYGIGAMTRDFLWPSDEMLDWIITNPPFKLGCDFALTALERAEVGVALLVRSVFLESVGRYEKLFKDHPPTVLQFVERVPMFRGRLSAKGSTATAYSWLVWEARSTTTPTHIHWIAPCRKRLERLGDYPINETK